MKIVYLGTPDFAVKPLEAIINSGYKIDAVITQVDKPVGRKMTLTPSPVKAFAVEKGIKVLQYEKIRLQGVDDLKTIAPDLMITCAYGQILSQEILDIPKLGIINIHASLLPELRGAAPIQWAIIKGYKQTGITIMKTDIGVDTGDILLQKPIDILPEETSGELFERLSVLGAECIVDALKLIESGKAKFTKQNDEKATHVKMLKKEDGKINWNSPAEEIVNLIRGANPWPTAFAYLNGETIKIWKASLRHGVGKVGEVIRSDKSLEVASGVGSIIIEELQIAGGKRMRIEDFLRGRKIPVGSFLK